MAFTLTQLAALEAAIASGELSVQYDGKRSSTAASATCARRTTWCAAR
ncbi:phage head-tail joining protein [Ralstonia syzygii subsp. celebesensis]